MKSIRFVCTYVALSSVFVVAQSTLGPDRHQPNGMPASQELHSAAPANFSQMPQVGSSARRRSSAAKKASGQIAAQSSGSNFAATVSYSSGTIGASSIAVGDLNGDGIPDLVVANGFGCSSPCPAGGVGVLLGRGDGTFQTAVIYASGASYTFSAAIADVNGDGKPDVVVANYCTNIYPVGGCPQTPFNTVGVLLGNGDGTFQTAVTYSSGGYGDPENFQTGSVAVADVNGDGKLDLVITNPCGDSTCTTNGTVGVLLGNGDGTFQAAVTYASGGFYADSVAVADVNADGKPDLVVANECVASVVNSTCSSNGSVGVLLGNGDGTFQTAVSYGSGGYYTNSLVVADVNADGKADLVVANECVTDVDADLCTSNGSVGVLLGNGDGTFHMAVTYDSGGSNVSSVALADVNGDGKLDVAVTVQCPASGCIAFGHSTVDVLLGNGDGTFQSAADYDAGGFPADSVAIKDVNSDGKPDILVANRCAWLGDNGFPCMDPPGGGMIGVLINASIDGTTTSLASSANPSTLGQSVTFTATVAAQPGFYPGVPTGTVNFLDGTTSLGSSALNSGGVATLTISTLAVGTHSITGAYSGAADFAPSTSAVLSQVVQGPVVALAPTSIAFPNQATGTTSAPQNVALMNTGTLALAITSIGVTGPSSAAFAQTNNCGTSLAAGATCQIMATFTPPVEGSFTADIRSSDNATGSPQTVSLSGGTVPAPLFSFSPSSMSFTSQYVGTLGLPQTLTVTNTGDAPLTITKVATSVSDFGTLNNCTNTVQPGENCTIGVFSDPTASGTRSGTLLITDNASGSPQAIALSGAGQDFSMSPSGSSSATVSPGQTASYTLTIMPGGGFNQTVALSCGGAPAKSTCSVSPNSLALTGSKATSVTVTATTSATAASLYLEHLPPSNPWLALWLVVPGLSGLMLLGISGSRPNRRYGRLRYGLASACILFIGITFYGCGGNGSGNSQGNGGGGTQAGTYQLTVTGQFTTGSTTLTHNTQLTLIVQ